MKNTWDPPKKFKAREKKTNGSINLSLMLAGKRKINLLYSPLLIRSVSINNTKTIKFTLSNF